MPFSKKPVGAATFGSSKGFSAAGTQPIRAASPAERERRKAGLSLGEVESLPAAQSYASRYSAPARLNLTQALAMGRLRNPLEMLHKSQKYAIERPATAASVEGHARSSSRLGARKEKKASAPILYVQRVDLPAYLNTPSRRSLDDPTPTAEERLTILAKIRDMEMLMGACRRANKVREEGRAVFSLGVHQDNLENYQKSLDHYSEFLKICKECKDSQGCSLAYHCLAVCHQLLGSVDPVKPANLRRALFFHNKHRDTTDSSGKIIAHLNMGICYAYLNEHESSTINHQIALKYAVERNSVEGQTLALGNLGLSAGVCDDIEKQKMLVTKYMALAQEKQAAPLEKLGTLAARSGDFETGKYYFQEALNVAKDTHDRDRELSARVCLGIATGETKFAEHINALLNTTTTSKPYVNECVASEHISPASNEKTICESEN